jgi:prepilin-type N-terminal cleavage/methylation domain-containing protein
MKRNNKKGFTIVELVIVIAVIAILAGVLIPTFSGIVKNAKKSAALQEARSIYTQYVAAVDAQVEDVYIKVTDGSDTYYFEVADGKMKEEPTTPEAGDKVITSVSEDNVVSSETAS